MTTEYIAYIDKETGKFWDPDDRFPDAVKRYIEQAAKYEKIINTIKASKAKKFQDHVEKCVKPSSVKTEMIKERMRQKLELKRLMKEVKTK